MQSTGETTSLPDQRLAPREARRLERSSVRRGQAHHPWGGRLPGYTLHYPSPASANWKNRLLMSVFLAEYRKSSLRKLPEPVSRKALGTWLRGGSRNARGVNQPKRSLTLPQIKG